MEQLLATERPGAMVGDRRHGTAPGRPMRVTIVDLHALFADALALVLEREGFIVAKVDVSDRQASSAVVLAAALQRRSRLVFLGQDLGRMGSSVRLISPLAASGAAVVVLTDSADERAWGEAVRQGAKDVLPKSSSLRQAVGVAHRVRAGLPLMSRERRAALVAASVAEDEELRSLRTRFGRLTHRETEVLRALMSGREVREIARVHVVAEATVRSQVKSVLAKLEVRSQIAAVADARRIGWEVFGNDAGAPPPRLGGGAPHVAS